MSQLPLPGRLPPVAPRELSLSLPLSILPEIHGNKNKNIKSHFSHTVLSGIICFNPAARFIYSSRPWLGVCVFVWALERTHGLLLRYPLHTHTNPRESQLMVVVLSFNPNCSPETDKLTLVGCFVLFRPYKFLPIIPVFFRASLTHAQTHRARGIRSDSSPRRRGTTGWGVQHSLFIAVIYDALIRFGTRHRPTPYFDLVFV